MSPVTDLVMTGLEWVTITFGIGGDAEMLTVTLLSVYNSIVCIGTDSLMAVILQR